MMVGVKTAHSLRKTLTSGVIRTSLNMPERNYPLPMLDRKCLLASVGPTSDPPTRIWLVLKTASDLSTE